MIHGTLVKEQTKSKRLNGIDKESLREIEALLLAVPNLEEQYHVLKLIGYGKFFL